MRRIITSSKKKIEKTDNIQKTIVCYQLSELRTVVKKIKIRNKEQEIAVS
jgi:hypothetical protein